LNQWKKEALGRFRTTPPLQQASKDSPRTEEATTTTENGDGAEANMSPRAMEVEEGVDDEPSSDESSSTLSGMSSSTALLGMHIICFIYMSHT
jgi:hypothetical protein